MRYFSSKRFLICEENLSDLNPSLNHWNLVTCCDCLEIYIVFQKHVSQGWRFRNNKICHSSRGKQAYLPLHTSKVSVYNSQAGQLSIRQFIVEHCGSYSPSANCFFLQSILRYDLAPRSISADVTAREAARIPLTKVNSSLHLSAEGKLINILSLMDYILNLKTCWFTG